MKIPFLLLLSCISLHSVFAQKTTDNVKKSSLSHTLGYASFDNDYNGMFIGSAWHYSFGKHIFTKTSLSFELGNTPKKENNPIDRYYGIFGDIGINGSVRIFKNHIFMVGPHVGLSYLVVDKGNITSNGLFLGFNYGFSATYLISLNSRTDIGATYFKRYFIDSKFKTDRIGITVVRYF